MIDVFNKKVFAVVHLMHGVRGKKVEIKMKTLFWVLLKEK